MPVMVPLLGIPSAHEIVAGSAPQDIRTSRSHAGTKNTHIRQLFQELRTYRDVNPDDSI